jgi:excisionase family DNA binding protein
MDMERKKVFKSTVEREQYINGDLAVRGGGTVEDAAKRLSCDPQTIRRLIEEGKLGALIVPLKDGSQDIIVPESEIQRYGVARH